MLNNSTPLQQSIASTLQMLASSLKQLTNSAYGQPLHCFNNSSIGNHTRHVIELFIELNKGYNEGIVNYEKRKRDYKIETDINVAIDTIETLLNNINKPNKTLVLQTCFLDETLLNTQTNYFRELVYNLEHTVHHMALIRIGFAELFITNLPNEYGVAAATIKHQQQCAL